MRATCACGPACATWSSSLQPDVRLTPLQDILLCDLPNDREADIERTAGRAWRHAAATAFARAAVQHGLPGDPDLRPGPVRGRARAAERSSISSKRNWSGSAWTNEKISVRMTGCPNGCARPYQSDIGIVGRSGDKYTLFVGGNVLGTRLNFVLKDLVPFERDRADAGAAAGGVQEEAPRRRRRLRRLLPAAWARRSSAG